MVILLLFAFYSGRNNLEQVAFLEHNRVEAIDFNESWSTFQGKLAVGNENSKIANVELIINANKELHSIKFDVIARMNKKNETYHYSQCFLCENEEENQAFIWKGTLDEELQYDQLIEAKVFFDQVDKLFFNSFIVNERSHYLIVQSTGSFERIGLDGTYFVLKGDDLTEVIQKRNKNYEGFTLRILESQHLLSYGTNHDTRTIFLSDVKEVEE